MKSYLFGFCVFTCIVLVACAHTMDSPETIFPATPAGTTISTRFAVSEGFVRIEVDSNAFGYWLRNLPLKENTASVKLYNGSLKGNQSAHAAVVDLPIGNKDLHQCADAVMRLRADYLFSQKRFDEIHFHFTNGFDAQYSKWRKGQRIQVKGNQVQWVGGGQASDSKDSYWKYLETVFSYAGTLSLSKELYSKSSQDINIGDVFIQGGSPGHAVIVVDVAFNPQTREKIFMLAQSYMPAQEIQVLKNPNNSDLSPWYKVSNSTLETPEWDFSFSNLKSFTP